MGTPREAALQLIQEALATGVRGEVREWLLKAEAAASGTGKATLSRLDYEHLPVGAKLHDPDRPGLVMRHGARSGKVWIFRFTDPATGRKVEIQFGALHELFARRDRPVPGFLVLDQPSQIYFPEGRGDDRSIEALEDDDLISVMRVFALIRDVVASLYPDLQIIVTEHAEINQGW